MMEQKYVAAVIDCGSFSFKAGYSYEQYPSVMVPAPQEANRIFWEGLLRQLQDGRNIAAQKVVLSVPWDLPCDTRNNWSQILFQMGIKEVAMRSSAYFSAWPAERDRPALFLDIGESGSYSMVLLAGKPQTHTAASGAIGGSVLTRAMAMMLGDHDRDSHGVGDVTADRIKDARKLKEKFARVFANFDKSASEPQKTEDVAKIRSGCQCGDALFDPSKVFKMLKSDRPPCGICDLLMASLLKSNPEDRQQLIGNIVVTGGTSNIPGLRDRLQKEMEDRWELMGSRGDVKVHVLDSAEVSAWMGACRVARAIKYWSIRTKAEWVQQKGGDLSLSHVA